MAVNEMTEKIYQHERRIDSLEQYSRSNCLILHGCQDVPKNASNFEFENYVCKKINSNLQLSQPLKNKHIDICHILPSKKGKNPIIIKFIKRTIRNEIFFQKKFFKSDPSSAMKTKLSITESLTKRRLRLVEDAKKIFGFKNVWTLKGDVFCFFENKRHYLDDFGDIERVRFSK